MSSTLQLQKLCLRCGLEFTAQKTTTKYCSNQCASKAYKAQKRDQKVGREHLRVEKEKYEVKIEHIKKKPLMTITEAAFFIGVSRPTIYKYIREKVLHPMELNGKIFISSDEIYDKFNTFNINYSKPTANQLPIIDWYTIKEIKEKYKVKESWIFKIIRENNIPKVMKKGVGYYSKKHVDKYFPKDKHDSSIEEWYSVSDIVKTYGMTTTAIYSMVYENNIPKRKEGKKVFYSKIHVDIAKGATTEESLYYTTSEAMEKYNLTRDALYHYVSYHKIPKVKEGKYVKISRKELDKLLQEPILY